MSPEQARDLVGSVFQSWARSLIRYAFCRTGNRDIAEEIVQEAFLALYQNMLLAGAVANPRAWTLTVTRNLICKYRRAQVQSMVHIAECEQLAQQGPSVEAALAAADSLRKMLDVLTEREEEVILLRAECLRYDEIARELGISSGTVATLLSRAVRKMRESCGIKERDKFSAVDQGTLEQHAL